MEKLREFIQEKTIGIDLWLGETGEMSNLGVLTYVLIGIFIGAAGHALWQ